MNDDANGAWKPVGPVSALSSKHPTLAGSGADEVALCLAGGEVFAPSNYCTHAYARLSDGEIDGYEVICPLHGGSFDVRTGEATSLPCFDPIDVYPVKVEDGEIFVKFVKKSTGNA
jgi:naphthalene 1,2-dioxygenase ferredoxin component